MFGMFLFISTISKMAGWQAGKQTRHKEHYLSIQYTHYHSLSIRLQSYCYCAFDIVVSISEITTITVTLLLEML